jgi:hypothetical protein
MYFLNRNTSVQCNSEMTSATRRGDKPELWRPCRLHTDLELKICTRGHQIKLWIQLRSKTDRFQAFYLIAKWFGQEGKNYFMLYFTSDPSRLRFGCNHHYHHQPINVHTGLPYGSHIRRTGHNPPRAPSAN